MKKFLIIMGAICTLFLFGCDSIIQTKDKSDNQAIETIIQVESGKIQNDHTLVNTGELQQLIDQNLISGTKKDANQLTEEDINLMEKIIEKIEKK